MKRSHILPIALLTAALPGSAIAQEPTAPTEPTQPAVTCPTGEELRKDRSVLRATGLPAGGVLEGGVLKVAPAAGSADLLRVTTSRKSLLEVTKTADQVTFDVLGTDAEQLRVQRVKAKRGQLQFRLVSTVTGERTRSFNVVIKALECAPVETEESSEPKEPKEPKTESRGRGRGPETEAQREARREREAGQRGRGPETEAEREARTGDDR
jgi:hypothetical protein